MCTVSFVANTHGVIISSNRDENISRPDATIIHSLQSANGTHLFFPKDPAKGGSWFVINDKGEIAVLLNGAFENHTPSYPYAKSRGVILLELFQNDTVLPDFDKIDLTNIEPFTIIHYNKVDLHELRWDGAKKYCKSLLPTQSHIWSSATLYTREVQIRKQACFENFLTKYPLACEKDISGFHLQSTDDLENGFVIKRDNGIQTRSLTQAFVYSSQIQLTHHTLANTKTIITTIPVLS